MLSEKEIRTYNEIRAIVDEWSRLGEKIHPDDARWIGHITHRAPEAYLHRLFGSLEREAIGHLERQLDLSLANCFKELLLLHNGMTFFLTISASTAYGEAGRARTCLNSPSNPIRF
jgi:hypothetical protein